MGSAAFFGATVAFCTQAPWEGGGGPEDDMTMVLSFLMSFLGNGSLFGELNGANLPCCIVVCVYRSVSRLGDTMCWASNCVIFIWHILLVNLL